MIGGDEQHVYVYAALKRVCDQTGKPKDGLLRDKRFHSNFASVRRLTIYHRRALL